MPMLQGALTAMITPFADGSVDEDRLRQNVEFQIEQGIDGLVPVGTTGESPTLDHGEHNRVVDVVVEAAGGRVAVVAGTGSNSTREAVTMTRHAQKAGATATLQVNPYYNKPTQEGLYRHFTTIADATDLPVVLYNIPGRTAVALTIETIVRLAEHPNIVAIKEATGSLELASEIVACTGLIVLSGDDALTLPIMAVGGRGVISVASNLVPDRIHRLTELMLGGGLEEARRLHGGLLPLFKALFSETNPIPVKTAMRLLGRDTGELRLPMCAMSGANETRLGEALRGAGVTGTAAQAV